MGAWGGGWGKDPWGGDAYKGWGKDGGKASGKGKASKGAASPGKSGPPESSAEMPGVTDQRFVGTIKSFNEQRGFGFIECDELMEQFGGDTFLHNVQMQGFEVGQRVSFAVFLNKDGKPQGK